MSKLWDAVGARWALLAVVVGSLVAKLSVAWVVRGIPPIMDELDYVGLATAIEAGQGLLLSRGYLWPPGYPYFLAACGALFGDPSIAGRIAGVLVSTATIPLIYGIARRLYDTRAALAAAALFALYPNLFAFSHLLWPTTLFALPFALTFLLLVHEPQLSRRNAFFAGMSLGCAALVKAVALYFGPVACVWLLLRGGRDPVPPGSSSEPRATLRGRTVTALVLVGASLLPVLPWSVRNWVTFDRFVLLDTTLGRNLYLGNNVPPPASFDFPYHYRHPKYLEGLRPECRDEHPVDRDRCETRRAIAFALEHPGTTLARIPLKLADLYTPMSFPIRHVRKGYYGSKPTRWMEQIATLVFGVPWMALALLALMGLIWVPAPGRELILWWILYVMAVHSATIGVSRFRMVLVPYLMIAAAPLLVRSWARLWKEYGRDRRWAVAASVAGILALGALWSLRWGEVFDVFSAR